MSAIPLPVRLLDLRELDDVFNRATPFQQASMHADLHFYNQLMEEEKQALHRRYPNLQIAHPLSEASRSIRALWDYKARDLLLGMLAFGDDTLKRKLELVGHIAGDAPRTITAFTTSDAVVELTPPNAQGKRAFTLTPSRRPDAKVIRGAVTLKAPLRLGHTIDLGSVQTSDVLILAISLHDEVAGT